MNQTRTGMHWYKYKEGFMLEDKGGFRASSDARRSPKVLGMKAKWKEVTCCLPWPIVIGQRHPMHSKSR